MLWSMIMSMLNKYVYRSRISESKFRQIVKYFAVDLEAD
jgi:transposase